MAIQILASVLIALGLFLLWVATKSLFASGWFLKWLRGMFGFLALVLAVGGTVFALDLFSYSKSKEGEVLATLKFNKNASQDFDVEFITTKNGAKLYNLKGDLWQLDVRLIRTLELLGSELPSYKIERLSGRYLSLEEEKGLERSVYGFVDSPVDTWPWLVKQSWMKIIQASQGSAAYMPMTNGAIFQVSLTHQGLKAIPLNSQAKEASGAW